MELLIYINTNYIPKKFFMWLIDTIKLEFIKNIDKQKLSKIDKYLSQNIFTGSRKYTAYELLLMGINSLTPQVYSHRFAIRVNPNAIIPHYSTIKISTIMNLMEFGTMETPALHYFSEVFTDTKRKFNLLYQKFMEENSDA